MASLAHSLSDRIASDKDVLGYFMFTTKEMMGESARRVNAAYREGGEANTPHCKGPKPSRFNSALALNDRSKCGPT